MRDFEILYFKKSDHTFFKCEIKVLPVNSNKNILIRLNC